jgi:hypothetical protein
VSRIKARLALVTDICSDASVYYVENDRSESPCSEPIMDASLLDCCIRYYDMKDYSRQGTDSLMSFAFAEC